MMVRATAPGWYGGKRRRKGDEFRIADTDKVSKFWMELIPDPEGAVQAPAAGRVLALPGGEVDDDDLIGDEPISLSQVAKETERADRRALRLPDDEPMPQ